MRCVVVLLLCLLPVAPVTAGALLQRPAAVTRAGVRRAPGARRRARITRINRIVGRSQVPARPNRRAAQIEHATSELAIAPAAASLAAEHYEPELASGSQLTDLILRDFAHLIDPTESRELWNEYADSFASRMAETIAHAYPIYLEAKAQGHAQVRWMESVGFEFPPGGPAKIPSLPSILLALELGVQRHLGSGRLNDDQTIRPGRVFTNPTGEAITLDDGRVCPPTTATRTSAIAIGFGRRVPGGLVPMRDIVPVPRAFEMMAQGYFGIGETGGVGPDSLDNKLIFTLHDLTHHAVWLDHPELMADMRRTAINMQPGGSISALYPTLRENARYGDEFEPDHVRQLLDVSTDHPLYDYIVAELKQDPLFRSYFGQFVLGGGSKLGTHALLGSHGRPIEHKPMKAPPDQATEYMNGLGSAGREELTALYLLVRHGAARGRFSPRHRAGIRYTIFLETSSLLPPEQAQTYKQALLRKRLLPPNPPERLRVPAVKAHLETLSTKELEQGLEYAIAEYPKRVHYYGAASRDIIQLKTRFRREPQGFAHYFTMDYLVEQGRVALGRRARTRGEMIDTLARIQVAMIESGKVDIRGWLDAIANPEIAHDPDKYRHSEVYQWIVESGAFPKNHYYYAYLPYGSEGKMFLPGETIPAGERFTETTTR